MSSLFDRVGQVVRAEWNARFSEDDPRASDRDGDDAVDARLDDDALSPGRPTAPTRSPRRKGVLEADQAYRVLELAPGATLDEVREAAHAMARRYHPRTLSDVSDQAYAAQTVLETITDSLEILEAHLLPVSRASSANRPDRRDG